MIPLSGDLPRAKGVKSDSVESIDVTKGTSTLKRGFAHMLKNGVVMDVTTVEQAQIAEEAGAVSVMVLDKLPSDVRKAGGVARTASIRIIQDIMDHVTIPVMAKCRIGHVYEAKVLAEAILHIKKVNDELRTIKAIYDSGDKQDLVRMAREFKVSFELVEETAKIGRLPVVNFAAGGIATPADAAYLMSLGCDGIFVGSGIFKAEDAMERARATVLATTFWEDPDAVKEAQKMINEKQSMLGLDVNNLELRMQERGGSA